MSEDYSDDFVIEDEEETAGSNRSFLVSAGALIGIFIILAACLLSYAVIQQQRDANEAEIAEIESINATTEANNQIIEQTRQAVEEQQAIAEAEAAATAEALATQEAEAAALPPTSTPEPEGPSAAEIAATARAEQTAEAEQAAIDATATAEAVAADATATAEALTGDGSGNGTGTGDGSGTGTGSGGDGATTLPETGVEVWLIAAAALGMVGLLFVSRRLRTSG